MLKTRVVAALVFAPTLLAIVCVGGVPLALTCAGLSLLMLWEALRLLLPTTARRGAVRAAAWGAAGLVLAAQLMPWPAPLGSLSWAGVMVLLLLGALAESVSPAERIAAVTGALLAVGYSCALMPSLYLLRQRPDDGLSLALMALFCTWGADTGAYFAGRAVGRHKLAPGISPGKTLEGALGGLALALVVAVGLRLALHAPLSLAHTAAIGLLAAAAGILGDLAESLLKRAAGQKDSSHLIPGHGGVLDRFDGVLFACWFVYLYGQLVLPQKGFD